MSKLECVNKLCIKKEDCSLYRDPKNKSEESLSIKRTTFCTRNPKIWGIKNDTKK